MPAGIGYGPEAQQKMMARNRGPQQPGLSSALSALLAGGAGSGAMGGMGAVGGAPQSAGGPSFMPETVGMNRRQNSPAIQEVMYQRALSGSGGTNPGGAPQPAAPYGGVQTPGGSAMGAMNPMIAQLLMRARQGGMGAPGATPGMANPRLAAMMNSRRRMMQPTGAPGMAPGLGV